MCFKGKPVIIEKAKSFYNEMKISDKCTFSEDWLQNFKEPAAEGDIQMECHSD
jgi:hypothetical protein